MRTVLTLCLLLLAGCGGAPPGASAPYEPVELSPETSIKPAEVVSRPDETSADASASRRIVISTADLRLETEKPDSVHQQTVEIGLDYGGYILKSTPEQTSVRLPALSFHAALGRIEKLGKVIDRDISGEDITEQYRDLEIRLANALKTRERYLGLLKQAKNLQEIMRVESELERINRLIETLKGQINRYSDLTRYSTITVNTSQQTRSGPVGFAFEQMYKGVKWLFVRK